MCVSCRSAGGMDETGYIAPERKNMGITRKFIMMLKPSKDESRAAIRMPMDVMQKETRRATTVTSTTWTAVIRMPRKGMSTRMISAWATEMSGPEVALPITMERRGMGAPSIPFMNPKSRAPNAQMGEKNQHNK